MSGDKKKPKTPKIHPMDEMDLLKTRMKAMGVTARVDANARASKSLVDNIKSAHAEYKAGKPAAATKTLKQGPKIKAYIQKNARGGVGGGKQDWDEILMQRSGMYNNN